MSSRCLNLFLNLFYYIYLLLKLVLHNFDYQTLIWRDFAVL